MNNKKERKRKLTSVLSRRVLLNYSDAPKSGKARIVMI